MLTTEEIMADYYRKNNMVFVRNMPEPTDLRDKFAMATLTGLFLRSPYDIINKGELKLIAIDAYRIADAMIEARKGTE